MGDNRPKDEDAGETIDSAQAALEAAASVVRTLWTTFVLFGLYLFIAAGSVTHKHLLLEDPLKLPVLDVQLPLVAFFWVAPILFVIFHGYILLHLALMAEKARWVRRILNRLPNTDSVRIKTRRELSTHVFVQFMLRPKGKYLGPTGLAVRLISLATVVVMPIALLFLIQVQFLPYHGEWTTFVHRLAIVADIGLLWLLGPAVLRQKQTEKLSKAARRWGLAGGMALVAFSVGVARFPGEWAIILGSETDTHAVTRRLFETVPNEVTGLRSLPLSNTLVLPGARLVDPDKFNKNPDQPTLSLRGRDLRGAVLRRADLRGADFTGAMLNNADFTQANLEKGRFECAETGKKAERSETTARNEVTEFFDPEEALNEPDSSPRKILYDGCAQLQRARLIGAYLQGASLKGAQLQNGSLRNAQLQSASLDDAQLQGTSLNFAQLQGASLGKAQLQGAALLFARLQGASLDDAQLQGASLDSAQLQGASLDSAQLQGASLNNAKLQGASLDSAQLQGAALLFARLQGASLISAEIQGASLKNADFFLAHVERTFTHRTQSHDEAIWVGAYMNGIIYTRSRLLSLSWLFRVSFLKDKPSDLNDETIESWEKSALEHILNEGQQKKILERFARLKENDVEAQEEDEVVSAFWRDAEKKSIPQDEYLPRLAGFLGKLACSAHEAPHVARGLLRHRFPREVKNKDFPVQWIIEKMRAGKKDPTACPGVKGFTDKDWDAVDTLAAKAEN